MTEPEQLVANKMEVWKSKLLDVSNRNPLIRFRKQKASTLAIALPDSASLFKELDQGKQFTVAIDPQDKEEVGCSRLLVAAYDAEQKPDKVLYNLRSKSRTYRSDHGVNILFISFGSILWKEVGSDEFNESPLFLVPVSLERKDSFSPYRIVPLDEDAVFNPSIRKRLEMDYHLKFPDIDLDNDFELPTALQTLQNALPPASGWKVTGVSYLALFHFSKLLMYADLESGLGDMASSPVIRALCRRPVGAAPRTVEHAFTPGIRLSSSSRGQLPGAGR